MAALHRARELHPHAVLQGNFPTFDGFDDVRVEATLTLKRPTKSRGHGSRTGHTENEGEKESDETVLADVNSTDNTASADPPVAASDSLSNEKLADSVDGSKPPAVALESHSMVTLGDSDDEMARVDAVADPHVVASKEDFDDTAGAVSDDTTGAVSKVRRSTMRDPFEVIAMCSQQSQLRLDDLFFAVDTRRRG